MGEAQLIAEMDSTRVALTVGPTAMEPGVYPALPGAHPTVQAPGLGPGTGGRLGQASSAHTGEWPGAEAGRQALGSGAGGGAGAGEGAGAGVRAGAQGFDVGAGSGHWSKMEINMHRLLSRCEARAADASDAQLVADAKFHTVRPPCPTYSNTVPQYCSTVVLWLLAQASDAQLVADAKFHTVRPPCPWGEGVPKVHRTAPHPLPTALFYSTTVL